MRGATTRTVTGAVPTAETVDVAADRILVAVLGPCTVIDQTGREVVELSTIQQRILGRLAVAAGEAVTTDELADTVWSGAPPRTARAALQNQIARLRGKLGDDAIDTHGSSYRLTLRTDIDRIGHDLGRAEEMVSRDPAEARRLADASLAMWRGLPLAELDAWPRVTGARMWIAEGRRALEDLRLSAALQTGHLAWAIPEAERLVADSPDDERRWSALVTALERAGRRGDALAAYERARRHLAESLGLEPGDDLRHAVERILSPAHAATRPATRMVGRARVLDELVANLDSDAPLLLVGEPGIGKSRLLGALARRLRTSGLCVAEAVCSEYPTSATATLADLATALGQGLSPAHPPAIALRNAVLATRTLRPRVALLVDDLDRAGPSTVAALAEVARLPGTTVIAACIGPSAPHALASTAFVVPVPPFTEEETTALAAQVLDRTDVSSTSVWLQSMTGGNPAMLECLLDDAADWLPGGRELQGWEPSIAAREQVRRQVKRLDGPARMSVEAAAVLGASCSPRLLAELSSHEGLTAALEAGVLAQVPSPAGPLIAFRHGAMERTVLADLPPGRRSDLHYHAARLLRSAGGSPAAVATHAVAGGDVAPLESAELAIAAAVDSAVRGAHADAAAWYDAAADLARRSGDTGRRTAVGATIAMANSLRLAGRTSHGDMLVAAAEAAFVLGDATLIGEATFALLQLGESSDSGDLHDRAVEIARRADGLVTDTHLSACIAGAASLAHSMTGNAELCRELFDRAVRRAVEPRTRRQVLPFAYLALGHPRDRVQRAAIAEELLSLSRSVDDPVGLFEGLQLAFSVALQSGDGAALRGHLAEMEGLIDRVGDVGRRWSLAYQQAALAHVEGDLELAEQRSLEGLSVFSDVSPGRAMSAYGAQLLVIRLAQDRLAELTDAVRDLMRASPGIPAWNAALALCLAQEDPLAARHHAAVALDNHVEDFTWLAGHVIGGRAAALVGTQETIAEYLRRLTPYLGTCCWQGTCCYGPVDTVAAMLAEAAGDDERAAELRRSAARLASSLGSATFLADLEGATISTR